MAHPTPSAVGCAAEVVVIIRFPLLPLLALVSGTAFAQDAPPVPTFDRGFDAHGFVLAAHDADVRDGLVLQRPGALTAGHVFAGGVFEYAKSPLVLVDPDTDTRQVILDNIVAANVSVGGVLHERVRLDARVPLFFTSTGPDGGQGVGLGDIRLTGMGSILLPQDTGGWGLAVVPWIDLPSGVDQEYLGQRAVAGGGVLAATKEWSKVTATANVGAQLNPAVSVRNLQNADAVIAGLGGVYSVRTDTGIGLEVKGAVPITPSDVRGSGSPWEALASVRHVRDNGAFLTGGFATALTSGAGAAAFRVFLGGGFGRKLDLGPRDRDGDGIVNRDDACPDDPETVNAYLDEDGCPDALPALEVTVTENDAVASDVALQVVVDGAPTYDATVSEPVLVAVPPGSVAIEASKGSCLAGSRTLDVQEDTAVSVPLKPVQDALLQVRVVDPAGVPVEAASIELAPADDTCVAAVEMKKGRANGYVGPTTWTITAQAPEYTVAVGEAELVSGGDARVELTISPLRKLEKVRVDDTGIVLLEQVFFDTGKATLRPGSSEVLDEVVSAIGQLRPGVGGRVEIQGHTDNVGSDERNQALSQARAEAVRTYLVDSGVDPGRLTAKGYGESAPKTTNRTPEGRQANRRVEFVFLAEGDADPDPASPWDADPDPSSPWDAP
jgi:outer membrane protein OmpA-like peptidoglycan-associated protein